MQNFKNPHKFLGIHKNKSKYTITVLNKCAHSIIIIDDTTKKEYSTISLEEGVFQTSVDSMIENYSLKITYDNSICIEKDPYSFPLNISEFDLHLFNEGTHRHVWKVMGAHRIEINNIEGIRFSVWAPNAKSVRVIGDFNGWDNFRHFMCLHGNSGVWELFIPNLKEGERYKFAIETMDGTILEKTDPYGFYAEKRPNTASIVYDKQNHYQWNDEKWMNTRSKGYEKAISIYECHLSSWIKNEENFINYKDCAETLAEYLLEHGFTHIELMPITEYPYDGSWGYQVTGYFASTSRYGTPDDFMYFVDYLHQKGIGVIIDWVPAHFPSDGHGLARFDGTALYEHEDPRLGWHHDWSTYIFNYGRTEVRQFLIGSALYWLDKFHIDGLRVDAVASMLYLDYSRKEGEWIPNKYGGRENLEAIEFIQSLHAEINHYFPSAITIAEESTSFPGVTQSTDQGGLGFTYKWNMGWMNDTLDYFSIDPLFRKYHHHQITFSMIYAFSEHYILPFSHDEVVHGKGSLLSGMPGHSDWEKFAHLRALYSYMWGHPGKKLVFHGQEWGSWNEWSEDRSIDWHLNEFALHAGMRRMIRDLNLIYQSHSPLFELDKDSRGFSWVNCDDSESGLLMWTRWDSSGKGIHVILNLTPIARFNYRVGVPKQGKYHQIFNSDTDVYGGAHIINNEYLDSEHIKWQGQDNSLIVNIGPLACLMFEI